MYIHRQYNVRPLPLCPKPLNQPIERSVHSERIGKLSKSPVPVISVMIHTNEPIDMATARVGLPAASLGRVSNRVFSLKLIVFLLILSKHSERSPLKTHFKLAQHRKSIAVINIELTTDIR